MPQVLSEPQINLHFEPYVYTTHFTKMLNVPCIINLTDNYIGFGFSPNWMLPNAQIFLVLLLTPLLFFWQRCLFTLSSDENHFMRLWENML